MVAVDNPDLKLLPGMTARVDFHGGRGQDVLKVANAALRFRPEAQAAPAAGAAPRAARPVAGAGPATRSSWTLRRTGTLTAGAGATGLTDGVMTEVEGAGLAPGMEVIAGVPDGGGRAARRPIRSSRGGRRRGPPAAAAGSEETP